MPPPPASIRETGFRDPCLWKEDDGWYLGLGSGQRGKGGCVLLYRSQDLRHWKYLHPLVWGHWNGQHAANPCDSGEMWECPDFFPLGDRHCLLFSTRGQSFWSTGEYDRKRHTFTPQQRGCLDAGSYYAPKSFLAPDGRRILWGWIKEARPPAQFMAAGWAGAMSLPRVLTLGEDGRLRMTVAEEVKHLRESERRIEAGAMAAGRRQVELGALDACCGELELHAKSDGAPFTVGLLGSSEPNWLEIEYIPGQHPLIRIDRQSLPVTLKAAEPVHIHAYVDGSVIEVFLNRQKAFTKRFYYPGRAQNCRIFWRGNAGDLISASSWKLSAISPDRLAT